MHSFILTLLASVFVSTNALAQDCGSPSMPCRTESGSYHVLVPDADIRGTVVMLHGGGGSGKDLLSSRIAQEALARDFLFVAPNGEHPTARFPRNWAVRAENFVHKKDDMTFIGEVMDQVAKNYGVARDQMLLSGFSRGGSMTWDVACFAPQTARAYAPSAGAFWDPLPKTCNGPVDLIHTHGWNDRTVPLEGRPLWDGTVAQGDIWQSLRARFKSS